MHSLGTLLRRLQSRLDYLRFVYRGELSWLVALALFALSLPLAWLPTEVIVGGAIVGAAVALFGLVRTGLGIFREWRRAELVDLGAEPARAIEPQWDAGGSASAVVQFAAPADATAFWWDREVNEALWRRSRSPSAIVARVSERYRLPTRLQEIAGRALRYGRVAGKTRREQRGLPIRFNGRLLRLATEPTVAVIEQGELEFEGVTYFDGECSNELWTAGDRSTAGAESARSVVHDYACDRAGRMLALENARVANIVGISILAITTDDRAVLVRQSEGNSIAPGAWAASGSGSLEQRDLRAAARVGDADRSRASRRHDAADLILGGMLRELREESLVSKDEIDRDSARITAYWRWGQRAMKPELSGIVRVRVTGAELEARRHTGTERAFSAVVSTVPLAALLEGIEGGTLPIEGAMSPSTEVTLRAAAAFLDHPVGKEWRGAVPE